jgi:hypothetical protein
MPRAGFEPATDPDNDPFLRTSFSVFSRVLEALGSLPG